MRVLQLVAIAAVIVSPISVFAANTADFNGTWVLNTDRGENLGMVAAVEETLTITQTDTSLKVEHVSVFRGNESRREVSYDLTGEPVVNVAAMGDRSETVSSWDDGGIVTTWTSEGAIAGTSVTRVETRTLSADGKSMTVTLSRGSNPALVMVYERGE